MSELRALIVDAAIEYAAHEDLIDEIEAIVGWSDETDIGLHRAVELAHSEASDAHRRLMGLVRILMNQEGRNV